jgi:hypothetical protein
MPPARHRRTLGGYLLLPSYRNYWKQAGYEEEMAAIEAALAAGDRDRLTGLMTDAWLDDCTISGSAHAVRDRLEQWSAMGVLPIAVMSSTTGASRGDRRVVRCLRELSASSVCNEECICLPAKGL